MKPLVERAAGRVEVGGGGGRWGEGIRSLLDLNSEMSP